MDRQEGYYWVKGIWSTKHTIAYWDGNIWLTIDSTLVRKDSDFEHINEVRIKEPGELPD
jgi:hypothetical protein